MSVYKKGLAPLAIASFERSAAKKRPGECGVLYHLGLAQLKNSNKAEARESLQKALAAKADFPDAAEARRCSRAWVRGNAFSRVRELGFQPREPTQAPLRNSWQTRRQHRRLFPKAGRHIIPDAILGPPT